MSGKNLEDYDLISIIGTGTCGDVYKGRLKKTGDLVAIKKIKIHRLDFGFPMNSMREIKVLQQMKEIKQQDTIIRLREIATSKTTISSEVFLVFDYCEYDLEALLRFSKLTFDQSQCYMKQIITGLSYVHRNGWIHRDLKPANIFVMRNNHIKIGDFGLARSFRESIERPFTSEVITIWYRPPELLMGCKKYGCEVDVWSIGCILYEMLTREVLFRSMSDNKMQEMEIIFSICGFPDDSIWEKWAEYPESHLFRNMKSKPGNLSQYLDKKLPSECAQAKDLIMKMLRYDPSSRITIQEALNHPYMSGASLAPESLKQLAIEEMHQNMAVEQRARGRGRTVKAEKKKPTVI